MTSRRSVHSRRRTHRAVARLRPAPLGLAFLVFFVLLPLNAVFAADENLYLVGDGVPKATLSLSPPVGGTLPNYDPDRDDEPGLTLKKTDEGANETDPTKHQIWVWPVTGVVLDGKASLTFWSAMKDFDDSKGGDVEAYLLDCSPSGSECKVIESGSIRRNKWSAGSSGWVSRTIAFGSVSYSLPADRLLAVKVVVGDKSDDDMWFAYGVAKYPSALTLSLAAAAATATTSTTTTTAPTTTTTTTTAPTTTTTTATTTTTTTSAPATTTTTTAPATTPLTTTTTTTAPATTTPATTTTTTPPATASGGSGDDPANQDPSDVTLAAIPDSAEAATSGAEIDSGMTGDLLEGLELVVSPPIATALVSPLLVLEAFARALSGAGEALLVPGLLLLVGVLYLSNESRLKALLVQGVDAEGGDR